MSFWDHIPTWGSLGKGIENTLGFGNSDNRVRGLRDKVGGSFMNSQSRNEQALNGNFDQALGSMKKGGPVKKTGLYKLHKGEYVVTKKKVDMAEKMGDKSFSRMNPNTDRPLYHMSEGTYRPHNGDYTRESRRERDIVYD